MNLMERKGRKCFRRKPAEQLPNDWWLAANVPPRYKDALIVDHLPRYSYTKFLRGWGVQMRRNLCEGNGLFLWGESGHGKTHCAVALAKFAKRYGASIYLVDARNLLEYKLSHVDESRFRQDFSDVTRWENVLSVQFLVLDDLGHEHAKDFGVSLVEELIRFRNGHELSTIVTSQLSEGEIVDAYNQATLNVLRDRSLTLEIYGKCWWGKDRDTIKDRF